MKKKIYIFIIAAILVIGNTCSAFAANYAVCIGRNFDDATGDKPNLDTRIPTNVANRHFTNAGYDVTSYTTPTYNTLKGKNDDGTLRMSSSILYFNGEGDGSSVKWWHGVDHDDECGVIANSGITSTNYYTLTKNNYNTNDLILFMACNSSNMAKYAKETGGAKATVGFLYNVLTNDMSIWSQRLTLALSRGETLRDAVAYADNDERYSENTTVINHYVGGPDVVITNASRNSNTYRLYDFEIADSDELPTDDEINYGYVKYEVNSNIVYPINDDYELISEYIVNNINPQFDFDRFVVEKQDENTIRFHLMIDGFRADAGYILHFENGMLEYIAKSGNVNCDVKIVVNVDSVRSLEEINKHEYEGYTIIGQTQEKRINSFTKEIYISVNSFYKNNETGDIVGISEKINQDLYFAE